MERSFRGAGVAALAWLVAELSGCGSEVGGHVTEGDFASEFAHGVCSNMGDCCAAAGFPHEPSSCENTAREYFESYLANRKTLAVGYDAEAAGRCLDALTSALRSCTRSDNIDCQKMFKGRVAPGKACTDSEECAEQDGQRARCDSGVCAISEEKVGAGEACTGTCTIDGSSRSCSTSPSNSGSGSVNTNGFCYTNDGLSCGEEGRCVRVPGMGEPCTFSTGCQEGAFCDETGTCSARRDTGACGSSSDACSDRAYCDFDARECQPRKPDGAACVDGQECASDSCNAGQCGADFPVDADFCAGRFDD